MKNETSHLIERMLRGDRQSFEEIVTRYAEDVLRLAYVLLWDRDEAQDILQESLLRLVRVVRDGKFSRQNGSIKGFLITTARNLCIDRLRAKPNMLSFVEDESIEIQTIVLPESPDTATDRLRFETAFQEALGLLTPSQRTVLVLYEVNGETYQSIAEVLNVSLDKVRVDLHRARRKMRLMLAAFEELR